MGRNRSIVAVLLALLAVLACAGEASAYLHPQAGRFLQRDQEGYVDGMTLYAYVASSPLVAVDPTGLTANTCAQANVVVGKNWWFVEFVPGTVMPGSSFGKASGGGACAQYIAVFCRSAAALFKCCDMNDAGFYKWYPTVQAGASESSSNETAEVMYVDVPILIPLPINKAANLRPLLPITPSLAWWAPDPPPPWDMHKARQNIQRGGFASVYLGGLFTPVAAVTCGAGWASPKASTPPPAPSLP
jgi:hypothetical protein